MSSGTLTPISSQIWATTCREADKANHLESKYSNSSTPHLFSCRSSKHSTRHSSKNSTPERSRHSSKHSTPEGSKCSTPKHSHRSHRRPPSITIPETIPETIQTPPRGGVPRFITSKYEQPITPAREWRSPVFTVPYYEQTGPIIRVAYTDGNQSNFVEAPMKQGSTFGFTSLHGQVKFTY